MAKGNGRTMNTEVLIVGGGLAGITAALALRDSGLKITLVEKEPVLGGRARSWEDEETGDAIHNGPHIVMSKYPNMFKLLELLGTRDRIVWQKSGHFITMVDGRTETHMSSNPRIPAPFHFVRGLFEDKNLSFRDVLSNIPASLYVTQLSQEDVLKLDNINASAFLRAFGVSEHVIHRYWAFVCMAIMNVPIELCSAGALVRFYAGLLGVPNLEIGFPSCGLSDLYVPQAEALMEKSDVRILKKTEVKRFLGDIGHVTGVELADGRRLRATHTISALTPMALRRAAPREWIRSYKVFFELVHFHACPYFSTYLWFDRKLTDKQFWARAYNPNDLNCDFYDLSNVYTGYEGRGSLITANCIYCDRALGMSHEEIIEESVRELAEYLPAAKRAKLVHAVVNPIPMAIHCPYPGMEQRRPPTMSPVKNLYLAGDWIGTGIPSCMENACLSGWRAAEAVTEAIGRPKKWSIEIGPDEMRGFSRVVNRLGQVLPFDPVAELLKSRKNPRETFLQ